MFRQLFQPLVPAVPNGGTGSTMRRYRPYLMEVSAVPDGGIDRTKAGNEVGTRQGCGPQWAAAQYGLMNNCCGKRPRRGRR